jgi:hypothetical protein
VLAPLTLMVTCWPARPDITIPSLAVAATGLPAELPGDLSVLMASSECFAVPRPVCSISLPAAATNMHRPQLARPAHAQVSQGFPAQMTGGGQSRTRLQIEHLGGGGLLQYTRVGWPASSQVTCWSAPAPTQDQRLGDAHARQHGPCSPPVIVAHP